MSNRSHCHQPDVRFTLDRQRLGEHLRREYGASRGLDECHEPGGLGGSLRQRLNDANDAGAIQGPDGYEVQVHPRYDGDIILTVSSSTTWVTRPPIESKHLRKADRTSFAECCETLQWLLDQATPLIAQLRALTTHARCEPLNPEERSMLERVARELLMPSLAEERDAQDPQRRVDDTEFGRQLVTQASELAGRLRDTVAAFNGERSPLPSRRDSWRPAGSGGGQ